MILYFLILVSLAFSQVRVFSGEGNEALFSLKGSKEKKCLTGRISSSGGDYDALLGVCGRECVFYSARSSEDDYSYTVEWAGSRCVGGLTTMAEGDMDIALVPFGEKGVEKWVLYRGEGNDMLWYMVSVKGGYLLVGGVQEENWDILIVKLNHSFGVEWARRLGTESHEYAYGVVEHRRVYHVVGRSFFRGNWDAFLIELDEAGNLKESYLLGSEEKDYLRHVGLWGKKLVAVGRSEAPGDSDALLFLPEEGSYYLYDGGDFDYGRSFYGDEDVLVVVGDTYKEGVSDGMVLLLDRNMEVLGGFSVGGEDVESIRFVEQSTFVGYSYSVTLDNDVLLGSLGGVCGGFVRNKRFVKRRGSLRIYPYPIKRQPYSLETTELELETRRVVLKELNPCHE